MANESPWRPWKDMPIGDQRFVVREVCSEDGRTALAYWTGKFMALAPVSDDPVELPFKVWGQRPPSQPIPATATEPQMLAEGATPDRLWLHPEHGMLSGPLDGSEIAYNRSLSPNTLAEMGMAELHPDTTALIEDFRLALAYKLMRAQQKYGRANDWKIDDWEQDCKRDLMTHLAKGDPLDVAIYAAFCWARGWTTTPPQPKLRVTGFRGNPLRVVLSSGQHVSDVVEEMRGLAKHYMNALCEIIVTDDLEEVHAIAGKSLGSNPPRQNNEPVAWRWKWNQSSSGAWVLTDRRDVLSDTNKIVVPLYDHPTLEKHLDGLTELEAELLGALRSITGKLAVELHDKWDEGQRAGKLIIALADPTLKYRADISAIHDVMEKAASREADHG